MVRRRVSIAVVSAAMFAAIDVWGQTPAAPQQPAPQKPAPQKPAPRKPAAPQKPAAPKTTVSCGPDVAKALAGTWKAEPYRMKRTSEVGVQVFGANASDDSN